MRVYIRLWGRSSAGRAPALQAGGQEFESLRLHRRVRPAEEARTYLENRIPEAQEENQRHQPAKAGEPAAVCRWGTRRLRLRLKNRKNREGKACRHASRRAVAKLGRAQGGCLGAAGRRKTRQAAKSRGEGQIPNDPRVSEWGNPRRAGPCVPAHESIVRGRAPGELKHLSSRRRRRQK